jgi:hypothetical protein
MTRVIKQSLPEAAMMTVNLGVEDTHEEKRESGSTLLLTMVLELGKREIGESPPKAWPSIDPCRLGLQATPRVMLQMQLQALNPVRRHCQTPDDHSKGD